VGKARVVSKAERLAFARFGEWLEKLRESKRVPIKAVKEAIRARCAYARQVNSIYNRYQALERGSFITPLTEREATFFGDALGADGLWETYTKLMESVPPRERKMESYPHGQRGKTLDAGDKVVERLADGSERSFTITHRLFYRFPQAFVRILIEHEDFTVEIKRKQK
jgi:hypothetical protein